jgi:hypothetical protein
MARLNYLDFLKGSACKLLLVTCESTEVIGNHNKITVFLKFKNALDQALILLGCLLPHHISGLIKIAVDVLSGQLGPNFTPNLVHVEVFRLHRLFFAENFGVT